MLHDVAPALTAHFGIIHRRVVTGAAHTQRYRRRHHTVARQQFAIGKRAGALLAQQIRGRHFAIFQFNRRCRAMVPARHGVVRAAERGNRFLHVESGGIARNQKGGKAVHAGLFAVGAYLHRKQFRQRRIRHRFDVAVDNPVVALLDGGWRNDALIVRVTMVGPADAGLYRGTGKRQVVVVVFDKRLHVLGFLLGAHQRVEQRTAQRRGVAEYRRYIHFAGRELFEHDASGEVIRACAARFFRQRQCADAELRGLGEQIRHHRLFKRLQAIRMNRGRFHFALGKIAQRVAHFELFRGERQIEHKYLFPMDNSVMGYGQRSQSTEHAGRRDYSGNNTFWKVLCQHMNALERAGTRCFSAR